MRTEEIKRIAAIGLVLLVAGVFLFVALEQLPTFGSFPDRNVSGTYENLGVQRPVLENKSIGQQILENAPQESGGANVVTDVLWDYRGYDTLGEATVLFTAVVGIAALFRKRKEEEE